MLLHERPWFPPPKQNGSLSVALEESLKNAPERESRCLEALQKAMDDLLLAVLDRLPQTIASFPGGVGGCESVLEPEVVGVLRDRDFRGPLRLALQERQFSKTLCIAPLMFKYMCYRYVVGGFFSTGSAVRVSSSFIEFFIILFLCFCFCATSWVNICRRWCFWSSCITGMRFSQNGRVYAYQQQMFGGLGAVWAVVIWGR